jgi:succinate dehydrogenase/fumarate reductase-like Fe-S protein
MSSESQEVVNVVIDGKAIQAPPTLSVIQALWHAGYPRVKSVGCLEGVCGSCRVLIRRADEDGVNIELGCQTLVEEGMQAMFLVFPNPTHHHYRLSHIKNSWDLHAQFHRIFPEAAKCRHCGGCTTGCPKGIEVEKGVALANNGRFREAGELFVECIMCNICMTGCAEDIAPNHVGLFSRRVTAYFHSRPSNLIHRLEQIRKGELTIEEDNDE